MRRRCSLFLDCALAWSLPFIGGSPYSPQSVISEPFQIIAEGAVSFVPTNLIDGFCVEARTSKGREVRLVDKKGKSSQRLRLLAGERCLAYDAVRRELLKATRAKVGSQQERLALATDLQYFEAGNQLVELTDDSVFPSSNHDGPRISLPREWNTAVGYDPTAGALYQISAGANAQLKVSYRGPGKTNSIQLRTAEGKAVRRHLALRTIGILPSGCLAVELTVENFSSLELSRCWKVDIGRDTETCFARIDIKTGIVHPFGVFKRFVFGDFPPTTYQSFVVRGDRIFFIGDGKLYSAAVRD